MHTTTDHASRVDEEAPAGDPSAASTESIELIRERIDREADLYHWTDEQRAAEVRAATESEIGMLGTETSFDESALRPVLCASALPCFGGEKGVFRAPFVLYGDFSLGEIRREVWHDHFTPEHGLPIVGAPFPSQSRVAEIVWRESEVETKIAGRRHTEWINVSEATLTVLQYPPKSHCRFCQITGKLLTQAERVAIKIPSSYLVPCYPCGWLLSNQDFAHWIPNTNVESPGINPNSDLAQFFRGSFYVGVDVKHEGDVPESLSHHPLGPLSAVSDPNDVSFRSDQKPGAPGDDADMVKRPNPEPGSDLGTGLVSPAALRQTANTTTGVTSTQTDRHGECRITLRLGRAQNGRHELVVRVVEARGLKPADLNGLSDPYCEVALCDDDANHIRGTRKERTRTISKTLRPYFNECFRLGKDLSTKLHVASSCLRLRIFDYDKWTADDQLGSAVINLWMYNLSEIHPIEIWVPLARASSGWLSSLTSEGNFVGHQINTQKRQAIGKIETMLNEVGEKWAWSIVADPDMPSSIRSIMNSTIKAIWFEVEVVLMTILKGLAHVGAVSNYQTNSHQQAVTLDGSVCPFSCAHLCGITIVRDFIAWFRYNNYPADKDIWGQIKNPWWILFRVIGLYPTTQSPYFLLKFLIMERHDDYMLLNFVNEFKGLQLMTGLVQTLLGLVEMCACLLRTTISEDLDEMKVFIAGKAYNHTDGSPGTDAWMVPYEEIELHRCAYVGPGKSKGSSWWAPSWCDLNNGGQVCSTMLPFIDFLLKVFLCWFSIFLLRYSHSFGGKLFLDQRLEGASIDVLDTPDTSDGKRRHIWGVESTGPTGSDNHQPPKDEATSHSARPGWEKESRRRGIVTKYIPKTNLHEVEFKRETGGTHRELLNLSSSDTAFKIVRLPGSSRGLIKTLLTWDIFSLLIIVSSFLGIIIASRVNKGRQIGLNDGMLGEMPQGLWMLRVMLFWARVLYMSFSFPWLILKVPGVVKILTHAQKTGYTREGVCIRHRSPKIPWSDRYKW